MAKKKNLDEEIGDFLEYWDANKFINFLRRIITLFDLFDELDEEDWLEKEAGGGEQNVKAVGVVRAVYLISQIAEFHADQLTFINLNFKGLYKRMEKCGEEYEKSIKALEENDKIEI